MEDPLDIKGSSRYRDSLENTEKVSWILKTHERSSEYRRPTEGLAMTYRKLFKKNHRKSFGYGKTIKVFWTYRKSPGPTEGLRDILDIGELLKSF